MRKVIALICVHGRKEEVVRAEGKDIVVPRSRTGPPHLLPPTMRMVPELNYN